MSGFRIEIHTQQCLNRFDAKYQKAQKWLDNEVLKDCNPYVPFRTGNLAGSGIRGTTLGNGEIIYNAPYARRMYYGINFNFSKEAHPKACAQWFEKAKQEKKEAWVNGANKIIKGD